MAGLRDVRRANFFRDVSDVSTACHKKASKPLKPSTPFRIPPDSKMCCIRMCQTNAPHLQCLNMWPFCSPVLSQPAAIRCTTPESPTFSSHLPLGPVMAPWLSLTGWDFGSQSPVVIFLHRLLIDLDSWSQGAFRVLSPKVCYLGWFCVLLMNNRMGIPEPNGGLIHVLMWQIIGNSLNTMGKSWDIHCKWRFLLMGRSDVGFSSKPWLITRGYP